MSKKTPRKRIKVKGHYMKVRQHSSKKGRKGTIMGRWKSEKKGKRRTYRCKLTMSKRLQQFCSCEKAGFHCLKVRDNCPQLVISYQ